MAAEIEQQQGYVARFTAFIREVVAEMKRVTWPDLPQVRQLSIGVMVVTLVIGLVIFVIDQSLQLVLVTAIPTLFTGGG